jgi:hypothetical protein
MHSIRNITLRQGVENFRRIPRRTCNSGIISRTPTVLASSNLPKYEELAFLSNTNGSLNNTHNLHTSSRNVTSSNYASTDCVTSRKRRKRGCSWSWYHSPQIECWTGWYTCSTNFTQQMDPMDLPISMSCRLSSFTKFQTESWNRGFTLILGVTIWPWECF